MRRAISFCSAAACLLVMAWILFGTDAMGQGVRRNPAGGSVGTAKPDSDTGEGGRSAVDVRIQQITGTGAGSLVQPPDYEARNVTKTTTRPRNWCEIKVLYDTKLDWTDQMSFHFYVLMLTSDPDAKTKYTLLDGEVTYIDVPKGNNHIGAVYLHPNTLARFGEVVACAVVITSGGQEYDKSDISAKANVGGKKWWDAISGNASVTAKTGYILERGETPFALVNYDNYEQVLK